MQVLRRPHGWTTWLEGMLSLAPNLIVLELRLVTCPLELPHYGSLRHLDLAFADTDRSALLLGPHLCMWAPCALLHVVRLCPGT